MFVVSPVYLKLGFRIRCTPRLDEQHGLEKARLKVLDKLNPNFSTNPSPYNPRASKEKVA